MVLSGVVMVVLLIVICNWLILNLVLVKLLKIIDSCCEKLIGDVSKLFIGN